MPAEFSARLSPQVRPTINFVQDSPPRIARLDLNAANLRELQRLPGLSAAIARKIVSARKKQKFNHVGDLLTARIVSPATFERIRRAVQANGNELPYLYDLKAQPETVLYRKPFQLDILFDDSISGVRLVRLEIDSVNHSLDLTREVTDDERGLGSVSFELPAMEAGVINIQVSLYDNDGNKDHLARTLPVFHNPPVALFFPSGRTLRLSSGATRLTPDGTFHCDSDFILSNGTTFTSTLSRTLGWQIFDQFGGLLESGSTNFGFDITLRPSEVVTGWSVFSFPPGGVTADRLRAREQIRIEWQFTELGTGRIISDSLTWRALVGPDVNIIRVGEENFNNLQRLQIFNTLRNIVSSIFQQQDIEIGTINIGSISLAEAGGYVTIDNDGEAGSLTSAFTVPNSAMDMFVVLMYVGDTAGLSEINGSCNKDAKNMTGSVVEWEESQPDFAVVMAHELAHYLGLSHTTAMSNLMNPSVDASTTLLTPRQGLRMRAHCFIRFLG